jgi:flavin reductase (DIM6/NTAB) family NADH-FMN oxidoreductase RutF
MKNLQGLEDFISLSTEKSLWEHFYTVAPLVVIGTKEKNGFDLAPKHMVTPIGFSNYFAFVCTPRHSTYQNIKREKRFSVSYVKPDQIILSSIAAIPRCSVEDFPRDVIQHIPTVTSEDGESIFVADSYLFFDCDLHEIFDGFDDYSIITGTIQTAFIHKDYKIYADQEQQERIYENPLLVYLAHGRFAEIRKTMAYPYPKDFQR